MYFKEAVILLKLYKSNRNDNISDFNKIASNQFNILTRRCMFQLLNFDTKETIKSIFDVNKTNKEYDNEKIKKCLLLCSDVRLNDKDQNMDILKNHFIDIDEDIEYTFSNILDMAITDVENEFNSLSNWNSKNIEMLDVLTLHTKRFKEENTRQLYEVLMRGEEINYSILGNDEREHLLKKINGLKNNLGPDGWFLPSYTKEIKLKAYKNVEYFINNNDFDAFSWYVFKKEILDQFNNEGYKEHIKINKKDIIIKNEYFLDTIKNVYTGYEPIKMNSPLFRICFLLKLSQLKVSIDNVSFKIEKEFIKLFDDKKFDEKSAKEYFNILNNSIKGKYVQDYKENILVKFDLNDLKKVEDNKENILNASKIFF